MKEGKNNFSVIWIGSVVLLLMFYFGVNTTTKKTYSTEIVGSCGTGYALGEYTDNNKLYQYCCPSGTTYVKSGYCVDSDYTAVWQESSNKYACSITRTGKLQTCDCGNTGWQSTIGGLVHDGGRSYHYTSCTCTGGEITDCATEALAPTYSSGACFENEYGLGYEWTTSPSYGQKLATNYTTQEKCQIAHQEYLDSKMACYVNDKRNDYIWASEVTDDAWLVGDGYEINSAFTNEVSCLNNKVYTINYQASDGTTNVPSQQGKKYYDITFISTKIPVNGDLKFLYWEAAGGGTKYYPGDLYETNSNIYLNAVFEEDWLSEINDYERIKDKLIFNKVSVNTTIDKFKENVKLSEGFDFDISDYKTINNENVLYTGSLVKVVEDSNVVDSYAVVVTGDVNGDGKMSFTDYVDIYNHIADLKKFNIFGELAADYNEDGMVKLTDYVDIYNDIVSRNATN